MKKFLFLFFPLLLIFLFLSPKDSYAKTTCSFRFLDNSSAKNDLPKENGITTIGPTDVFYVQIYNLNASTNYRIEGKDSSGNQFTNGGAVKPSEKLSDNNYVPRANFGPINNGGKLAVGNYTIYAFEGSPPRGDGSQCGTSTFTVRDAGICVWLPGPPLQAQSNCKQGYAPADNIFPCTCIPEGLKNTLPSLLIDNHAPITPTSTPGPLDNPCKDNSCPTAFGINISTNPAEFVKTIFGILLSLAGGVALVLIMISGYRLMVSEGNPEKVQAAREQLTSAIVGLLFVIFSITILQIIGVDILKIPGFQ